MTAIYGLGNTTESIFLKQVNSHSLFEEFEVAAGETVNAGAPVKLNNAGAIVKAAADDKATIIIGYSLHTAAAGEYATIAMKAKGITFARSGAALNAGPVKYAGMNSTETQFADYVNVNGDGSEDGLLVGWALNDATAADEVITVAIV